MIRILFFLVFFPLLTLGQPPLDQNHYRDSLQSVVQNKQLGDSSRAQANYFLSSHYGKNDVAKAKAYLKDANKLAKKYPYLLAGAPFYEAYMLPDGDDRTLILYKKADSMLAKFPTTAAYIFRSKVWLNYASNLQFQDKQVEMVDIILNKAIPLAIKGKDNILLSYMYADLATSMSNIAQHEQAATYYLKAVEGLKNVKSKSSRIPSVYIAAASSFCQSDKFKQAGIMLAEANKRLLPYPKSTAYPEYYTVESIYLNGISKPKEAIKSAEKGLALAKELQMDYLITGLLFEKMHSFKLLNDYKAAEKIFNELRDEKTFQSFSNSRKWAYKLIAEAYAGGKQFPKAYYWMQQYNEINDSISNSQLNNQINELEARYRSQENLNKITVLKSQKDEAEFRAENNRLMNWLFATAGLFFLVLLLLVILNQRQSRQLASQEMISYQQQLKELAQQKQLQVSSALIEGEERERKRIARDLHDGLGGMLAGTKLHLAALLQQSEHSESGEKGAAIIEQIDHTLSELRRIAKNMMPETLVKFGLERAILDLCISSATPRLKIDFQSFGIREDLPEKTQSMIYRIIQEILSNAIRHASASTIMIQCSQNENIFLITAEDDGNGFDIDSEKNKTGMGLDNIKNRVEYLNGRLDLSSTLQEGTVINIELDVYKAS